MKDTRISHVPDGYEEILRDSEAIQFGMPSDMQTGALLRMLAASKPSGTFLELGTGTGLGAAWLLAGMDEASTLVSIETNKEFQEIAGRHLGNDLRLKLIGCDALDFIEAHEGNAFDLIYADAMPGKYIGFEHSLRLLRSGGILVLDDMLPQPNWPENHQAKVDDLLQTIDRLPPELFATVKLCWFTGHILITKKS
jgi:predicted O-methyltransferase YrrM